MATNHKASKLHSEAVGLLESTSLKQWATSAHNLPQLIGAAAAALKQNKKLTARQWATYLTLLALG